MKGVPGEDGCLREGRPVLDAGRVCQNGAEAVGRQEYRGARDGRRTRGRGTDSGPSESFERAQLEHKTRAEYVPEQSSSGAGVHSMQPHKNYTIAFCVPLAASLARFDSMITTTRPPDSTSLLRHQSPSQSSERFESKHSSQFGMAARARNVCLTPQRVRPALNELLAPRERRSCGPREPVSPVPASSSSGADLQMPSFKPTPYLSLPQMQFINPIRPLAQTHMTASSPQSTSPQFIRQVQRPQANSVYSREVREYYPVQPEPVYVPDPFLQEGTSDDSFVPESSTEILWYVSLW